MNSVEPMESRQGRTRFQRAAAAGFGRIVAAGWLTHGGMGGWRDLGHYAVALVVEGGGTYQDEQAAEHPVEAGSMIISFPGLRHFYRPHRGTSWTEFYLVFDGPVFALWERSGLFSRRAPVIQVAAADHWARRLESALGPSGRPGTEPAVVEACRLQAVLAELLWRGPAGGAGQEDLDWALRARALLETDLSQDPPIDEIAARFAMGAAAFRRKFARLVGESPARYRSARRIDRACELMQTTSLRDKEIAEKLGFCDEFYFSRRFREITGKSPRAFRAILPSGAAGEGGG